MLSDNLKILRKQKGLSQGELAGQLNVVRQTISKWEQGLSVPDSDMLILIAQALDTTVSTLLGDTVEQEEQELSLRDLAAKLEILNEEYAKSKENKRKLIRGLSIVAALMCVATLVSAILPYISLIQESQSPSASSVGIIGGADGPTAIFITSRAYWIKPFVLPLVLGILAAIGVYKTKKND